MWQTLFYIPFTHVPVYGYGVMLVIGFIAAMYLAQFLARRTHLDPELFANVAIVALVSGVIGARLSHVVENLPQYMNPNLSGWDNFKNAINIREGGLTYYGGFLLAFPACVLYGLWKKIPIRPGMDILAPCIMIGLAFGRIGCFLNGCCYGANTNVPWAVEFPYGSDAYATQFYQNQLHMPVPRDLIHNGTNLAIYMDDNHMTEVQEPLSPEIFREVDGTSLKSREQIAKEWNNIADVDKAPHTTIGDLVKNQHANPVHPAEIYSSITAFLIAGFLLAYFTLPHAPGRIFAAMMMIEGIFRYVLEMLRVEPPVVGHGTRYLQFLPPQSYSMVVSFLLVTGGVMLWYAFGRMANAGAKSASSNARPAMAQ